MEYLTTQSLVLSDVELEMDAIIQRLRYRVGEISADPNLDDDKRRRLILQTLKQMHQAGLKIIKLALNTDIKGRFVALQIAKLNDGIIATIYDYAVNKAFPLANPSTCERCAIVAVGGYGRSAMAPFSDMDLLILLPYKLTAWVENVIECILYLLWDTGRTFDYAVRTVSECIRYAQKDMTIRTALLEARFLFGDRELFDELHLRFNHEVVTRSAKQFITAKLEERNIRHAKTGETRYLIEPNVKASKGGLRDLQTLFWIGKYAFQVAEHHQLVDAGLFSGKELESFLSAEDFLWRVRCHLHFCADRCEDLLLLELQPKIARLLNYHSSVGLQAVECFMRDYYLTVKTVGDLTRILCAVLELRHVKATPNLADGVKSSDLLVANDPDFIIENHRINVTNSWPSSPASIINLFRIAAITNLRFHPMALQAALRQSNDIDDKLRHDPIANRLFMEILINLRSTNNVLRRMNETGVLGAFIPEFGKITGLMPVSLYHYYPVDEHLLQAVARLVELERQNLVKDHPLASEIIKIVGNRKVLYLAVFLHDIGKGDKEHHSIIGKQIAIKLAPRFGLNEHETRLLGWLVENHLLMSHTAQNRDLSDPKTITWFSDKVATLERLQILLILTIVDIAVVRPDAWNGWKGQLLRTLYSHTKQVLGGISLTTDRRAAKAKSTLSKVLIGWSEKEKRYYLTRHQPTYWATVESYRMKKHANLIKTADAKGLKFAKLITVKQNENITVISIYVPDHPHLLSIISGSCAKLKANIVSAQIFTTVDSHALDSIYIERTFQNDRDELRRATAITELIEARLAGRDDDFEHELFEDQHGQISTCMVKTKIRVYKNLSDSYTVIDISAMDQIGLLAILSRVFSDLAVNIASAYVTTYGEKAVDTFYVCELNGAKIIDDGRINVITNALLMALTD